MNIFIQILWKEIVEVSASNLTINVDAMINFPEANEFSVVAVEPMFIQIDIAEKIAKVATQGSPLYSRLCQNIRTKEMIEEEILKIQAFLANPSKSDLYNNRNNKLDEWETYKKNQEEQIMLLQIEHQTAPESQEMKLEKMEYHRQFIETDIELPKGYSNESWNMLTVEEQQEVLYKQAPEAYDKLQCIEGFYYYKEQYGLLNVFNHIGKLRNNFARFTREQIQLPASHITGNLIISKNLNNLRDISLSATDAENIAKNAITEMGIEGMDISYRLATIKKQRKTKETECPQCYMFVFSKNINGVPTTYEIKHIGYNEEKPYDECWEYEYIIVGVDDTGIVSFEWYGPSQITETLTNNVELLSFDKIQHIFRQHIVIQEIWHNDENIKSTSINIDNIKLGMMRIKSPDSKTGYLLVPVWDFFGNSAMTFKDSSGREALLNKNEELILNEYGYSFLTINAIDGSIIDRSLGY